MSGDNFFIVDDRSIDYQTRDLWFPTTADGAYQGTVTAGLAGAKASFQFRGTAVEVVGLVSAVAKAGPPAAQFSVDGNIIQTTTAPSDGTDNPQFVYFVLEGLDSRLQHEIEINVLNATNQYPFVLDAVVYLPVEGATPTGSQSLYTTTLPTFTGAPVNTATAASASSSGPPVGAIVGGVVGGLAVIVAACIAIWFLCFRRRRSNGQPYFYAKSGSADLDNELKHSPTPPDVRPQSMAATSTLAPQLYNPGPQSAPSAYSAPSQYAPPSGLGYSSHTPSERPLSDYGSNAAGSSHVPSLVLATGSIPRVTSSPNQARSKAAEAGLLSVPQEATFHADSGIRFDANGQPMLQASSSSSAAILAAGPELADVPPTYSAA